MLSQRLRKITEKVKGLAEFVDDQVSQLRSELEAAAHDWPDHQIMRVDDWNSRDAVPPKGAIWASDGTGVWLIFSDGTPIASAATKVRYWTAALIPAPPVVERHSDGQFLPERRTDKSGTRESDGGTKG